MRILLAAGIFFPDVGGPAIHVRKIAEEFSSKGHDVTVIAYGDDKTSKKFPFKVHRVSRKYNKAIQWIKYLFLAIKYGYSSKLIYAFDPTAAGLPACLVSWIFRKPFVIRIGGDPIWERTIEMGKRFMTIEEYYKQGLYKVDKPLMYFLIKKLLSHSKRIVVYSQFFRDFYINYYDAKPERITIIKNPVYQTEQSFTEFKNEPYILFAGRFVNYKNLPLVIKSIVNVRNKISNIKLVLIGNGPDKNQLLNLVNEMNAKDYVIFKDSLPQEELFNFIRNSAICIGPALSEFNPNFILESLSLGKPVLLTKGNGLSINLPEQFLFDAFDGIELENKIIEIINNYKDSVNTVNSLPLNQSWDKVMESHLSIINEISVL